MYINWFTCFGFLSELSDVHVNTSDLIITMISLLHNVMVSTGSKIPDWTETIRWRTSLTALHV